MATDKLSRREREIMDVLFALGNNGTAEEIRGRLSDPPTYSAVRAMLVKLEAKGHIRHRAEGLKYVYSPTTSKATAQKKAVSQLMRVFFSGSPAQAVTALLIHDQWTDDELEDCERRSKRSKNRRKSRSSSISPRPPRWPSSAIGTRLAARTRASVNTCCFAHIQLLIALPAFILAAR